MLAQDTTRTFKEFALPLKEDLQKKYTYRVEKPVEDEIEPSWPRPTVIIELNHEDGSKEDIYTYERNFSMRNTFEAFRQLKDGLWREYALISSNYTSFEVLDLATRKIIAKEAVPTITQEHHDRWRAMGYEKWCEDSPIGTKKPEWGFCPIDFYAPDWWEEFEEKSPSVLRSSENGGFLFSEEDLMNPCGQFALYSGCVWGEDHSWKLRYIDLSRITEGVVTSEDRFGYFPVASGVSEGRRLRDVVEIFDGKYATIPLAAHVNLKTGKASIGEPHIAEIV